MGNEKEAYNDGNLLCQIGWKGYWENEKPL